jgi:hypothetical protein
MQFAQMARWSDFKEKRDKMIYDYILCLKKNDLKKRLLIQVKTGMFVRAIWKRF